MTPPALVQLGSVVWAELEDENGIRKARPAVVVSATADVAAGKPVRVAAITTRLSQPLPDDHVLLPWDPRGKARSGLRRRCAAVASWLAEIPAGEVPQPVGLLPAAVVRELLTRVAALPAPPVPPTDPGTAPPGPASTDPSPPPG